MSEFAVEPLPEDRTLVSSFEDRAAAENAVGALHAAGFPNESIGFVLRGRDVASGGMLTDAEGAKDGKGAATGAVTGGIVGGVVAAAASYIMPELGPFVAGGVLATFFGGAVAGTAVGGILGALTGLGVSENKAELYDRQFRSGRAIVAVKPGGRLAVATEILTRFGGSNIHTETQSPVPTEGFFSTP